MRSAFDIIGVFLSLSGIFTRRDLTIQPSFLFIMSTEHNHSDDPLHAKKEAWSGRFSEPVAEFVLRYTQSVSFDKRMAMADIAGSLAHAQMLAACRQIPLAA